MSSETHRGSCRCNTTRFEAEAGLEAGAARGSCSLHRKTRFWLIVRPAANVRLLDGEETLADDRFGAGRRIQCCRRCGAKPFGMVADDGGVVVNAACLDDAAADRPASQSARYVDRAYDRWDAAPAVTAHL